MVTSSSKSNRSGSSGRICVDLSRLGAEGERVSKESPAAEAAAVERARDEGSGPA